MCGIAGSYLANFDVDAALDRISHRGPDGRGTLQDGEMTHGHVRLSILDLSAASNQPFRYRDGVLTFTGEIWNFRELREELAGLGHVFHTSGDTEVLAAALWQWSVFALPRVDGMFTFAWSRGAVHLLARDRWGKVPLYVLRLGGRGFLWSNERKAFSSPLAAKAQALPPASWLDLDTGTVRRYYACPEMSRNVQKCPEMSTAAQALELLRAGVRKRLVADAPLCCLISGGLDSSLLLALALAERPGIVAYTAVLGEDSPDLEASRRLCKELGVELREVRTGPLSAEALDAAARSIEIPSQVQVEIASLCIPLARRIAANDFKVCLSGESADEIFGGYGNMAIKAHKQGDAVWRQIRLDQLAKMGRGNFVRCNKAFMAEGVECRLPFMERDLVELALSLGKTDCPPGKGLLKRAAAGIVPEWVIRRQKETFQGGAGADHEAERLVGDRKAFYKEAMRRHFGGVPGE